MKLDECYYLGRIVKPHGIHGELKAYFDVNDPAQYLELERVFVLEGRELVRYTVECVSPFQGNMVLLSLKEVDDRNAAEALSKKDLYLPLADLPALDETRFYYHEIIGFTVVDEKLGEVGPVEGVEEMPAQDLLQVRYRGHLVLVPITWDFVLRVDRAAKTLHTRLPEGLLEVFLPDTQPAPKPADDDATPRKPRKLPPWKRKKLEALAEKQQNGHPAEPKPGSGEEE